MNTSTTIRTLAGSLFALLSVAVAIVPAQKPTPTPERPREIVALINDARLAAPELAVDTLLKLVETKRVKDPVWRKEIIDEALRTIDDVQYPIRMHAGIRPDRDGTIRSLNDTEPYFMIGAYAAKLDKLSLKGRVITTLLETEPHRAKQMVFQMGGDLGLKPRSCEDVLTYVPDDIYPIVANVAKAVFTEKQVGEGQRALFIAPWIENIESPRQIYPALALVREMQGSPAERQILMGAMSRAMDRDFKDDRSFTSLIPAIAARTARLTEGDVDPQKLDLKNAFRSMMMKNLTGKRCKDNEIKPNESLPDYIEAANKLFPEKPITLEDLEGAEYSGVPKVTHILQKSSMARKFRDELIAVRGQKVVDNKIVNQDPNDAEWASRVIEMIDRILAAEGSDGETENEMLYLKGAFLGGMLSGIDAGELRKSIVRRYLRLIVGSKLQKTSFIQWRLWLSDAERMAPDSFDEIAAEFPNTNLGVILAAKKVLKLAEKEQKPTESQPGKPSQTPPGKSS